MSNDKRDGLFIGMAIVLVAMCLFIAGYGHGYGDASRCITKHPKTAAQDCAK